MLRGVETENVCNDWRTVERKERFRLDSTEGFEVGGPQEAECYYVWMRDYELRFFRGSADRNGRIRANHKHLIFTLHEVTGISS